MRKLVKWIGIIVGGLLLLVVVAVVGVSIAGAARLNETYAVETAAVSLPTDAAGLSSQPMIEDPAMGTIYAPNITGAADIYSDEELVRAIRHGLNQEGQPLLIMPAESFVHFSAEDLGAIIAYLKTIPRTRADTPVPEYGPLGRALVGAGLMDQSLPATYIDHAMPFHAMPEVGANVDYGEYLARLCTGCHGPDLAGGQPPNPDSPPGPNLTPGGELQGWTEADFIKAMRTGAARLSLAQVSYHRRPLGLRSGGHGWGRFL